MGAKTDSPGTFAVAGEADALPIFELMEKVRGGDDRDTVAVCTFQDILSRTKDGHLVVFKNASGAVMAVCGFEFQVCDSFETSSLFRDFHVDSAEGRFLHLRECGEREMVPSSRARDPEWHRHQSDAEIKSCLKKSFQLPLKNSVAAVGYINSFFVDVSARSDPQVAMRLLMVTTTVLGRKLGNAVKKKVSSTDSADVDLVAAFATSVHLGTKLLNSWHVVGVENFSNSVRRSSGKAIPDYQGATVFYFEDVFPGTENRATFYCSREKFRAKPPSKL
jgi:hypothetical protein